MPVSVSEEFLRFLKAGICSPALTQFFSKELMGFKFLLKMDEKFNTNFDMIQDLMLESFLNIIERILLIVSKLESLVNKF